MDTRTDANEVLPRKEKQRSSREGRLQPRTTGEKREGEEQSQERRLENQRQPYKFPSWKSRVAPRDLGERLKENIKRWKKVELEV